MNSTNAGRRLPVELALYRTSSARHRLPAVLGRGGLVMLGIGVMVGGGIYSLAGQEAASTAGPAVIVSFAIGSLVCVLAGLCYAELSSTLPVSGSVYTFSYVAFGEVWAWVVGWALVLELVMAAAVVSRVFTQYAVSTLDSAGVALPSTIADLGGFTGWNVLAPVTLVLLTLMIASGTRLTGRLVSGLVVVKTAIVLVLVVAGLRAMDTANFSRFVPDPVATDSSSLLSTLTGFGESSFGWAGVLVAVGPVVFAYVGFDLISTSAEEARDPRRSVPFGILASLGIVTVMYLAMAVVLVGLRPYQELGSDAPMVDALEAAGAGGWVTVTVGLGAVLGSLTVLMVVLTALSRVLFSMGRDGLLPHRLGEVSRRWNSPARAAVLGGLAAAALSTYTEVLALADTLVLAALFTFFFCAVGVIVLRVRQPELERGFRIAGGPVVPVLAAAAVAWFSLTLEGEIWAYFGGWLLIGAVVYAVWGRRHSRLAHDVTLPSQDRTTTVPTAVVAGRHRR